MRVVDSRLGLGAPGLFSLRVIRENADQFDLAWVAEVRFLQILKLAAENKMQ
jgi:hypothetical protein